jgi:putative FmdB family regulatory protein
MPLYEYECQKCGQRTEVLQSFNEAPRTVCPACGGDLKKLLSAPAVQFKGSGWYVTDYAGKGSGKSGSAEGKAEKSEKADSGKTETAAAATETKTKTETKSSGGSSGSSGE